MGVLNLSTTVCYMSIVMSHQGGQGIAGPLGPFGSVMQVDIDTEVLEWQCYFAERLIYRPWRIRAWGELHPWLYADLANLVTAYAEPSRRTKGIDFDELFAAAIVCGMAVWICFVYIGWIHCICTWAQTL
jgi:hypothetical protein